MYMLYHNYQIFTVGSIKIDLEIWKQHKTNISFYTASMMLQYRVSCNIQSKLSILYYSLFWCITVWTTEKSYSIHCPTFNNPVLFIYQFSLFPRLYTKFTFCLLHITYSVKVLHNQVFFIYYAFTTLLLHLNK